MAGERLVVPVTNTGTGYGSYERLAELRRALDARPGDAVTIDCSGVSWFEGNMCASMMAVVAGDLRAGRDVSLLPPTSADVVTCWKRNGFGAKLGLPKLPDGYGTSVRLESFDASRPHAPHDYVRRAFSEKRHELPEMTDRLLRRLCEQLCEVFANALEHSGDGTRVYSCGQSYPTKKQFKFTIADTGHGFAGSVGGFVGRAVRAADAVAWALQGHSSRPRGEARGSGLTLLQEFVRHNRGKLVIVSGDAYWELSGGAVWTGSLSHPLPGSAVTMEIRTGDPAAYDLATGTDTE